MAERLELWTLGGLRIWLGGQPLTSFKQRKASALLVYLAYTGRTHPREALAELFWNERSRSDALRDLRGVLHDLNQTVRAYLEITHETVSIRAGSDVWIDQGEFEKHLEAHQLEAALNLYQGDFLSGFYVDSAAFEQWITRERERLRLLAIEGLDRLIAHRLAQGNYSAGIIEAMRLFEMDSLREETYRKMMDLLARSGQRTQALDQYSRLCRMLDEEFGLTPLPETVVLYEQIRSGVVMVNEDTAEPHLVAAQAGIVRNPYKGLSAFDEKDADNFYGREALTERLLARLAEEHELARFLAVVGPSGSGKSSVVRAGLIPTLRRDTLPGSADWYVVTLLPGVSPYNELEAALRRVFPNTPVSLQDDLQRDESGLIHAARLCLQDDHHELLLFIDQFEELFTLVPDPETTSRFLACLQTAVTTPHSPVRVLVTLRADFYDRPLMIPGFCEILRQRTEVVTPMSPEELERAVTRPAERVGVTLEAGLAAAIVAQVSQQPGALPMMEYALTEMFERRTDQLLKRVTYDEIGGVSGALVRRAEEVFERLNPDRQAAARQICLRLVALGEGSEDTRRRTLQSELISAGGEATRAALYAYDRARLLTFDHDPGTQQPSIELAHEAIIREWGRLRQWLDESRVDVRQQRLLAAAAQEWHSSNAQRDYLLTGSRLTQFADWAAETDVGLTRDERIFLETSRMEDQQRRARRRRGRNTVLVVSIVIALVMTALALLALNREQQAKEARVKAEREAQVNHSLVLTNTAQLQFENGETDLALALALEAVNIDDPPPETVRILSSVATGMGTRALLRDQGNPVKVVAFSPDGKQALSGSCATLVDGDCTEGELIVWDIETATELRQLRGHTNWITSVAFDPTTPEHALSASQDGTLILWNVETGDLIRRMEGHRGGVNSVAFGSDGKIALSGSDDFDVILWDLPTGQIIRRFEGHTDCVTSVAFSPDQKLIAAGAGTGDSNILLWDITTGHVVQKLTGPISRIMSVGFRTNEQEQVVVYSTNRDNAYREWTLDSDKPVRTVSFTNTLSGVTLSPDQRTALECEGNLCNLLTISSWSLINQIIAPARQLIRSNTISPNGKLALIGTEAGELILVNLPLSTEVRRFHAAGGMVGLDVSPDGRYLLTGGYTNGTAILWDLQTGHEIRRLVGQAPSVMYVTFSPDGRQALILSNAAFSGLPGGKVVLWDVETGKIIHELAGHEYLPRTAAFSPDGRTALTGTLQWGEAWEEEGVDGELILWDLAAGQEIRRFEPQLSRLEVRFSPDSRHAVTANSVYHHIALFDVATGQQIRQFDVFSHVVLFTSDPQYFLAASQGGIIFLINASTGEIVRQFSGQTASFWAMDLSPDEKYLFGGGGQGMFSLWDFETGREIQRFRGYSASTVVWNIVFSPDGQTAFSSTLEPEGDVIEWRISNWPLDILLGWVHENRYIRDFTCEERAQYHIEPLCDEEKQ